MKVDPRHLVQLSAIIEKKSFTLAAECLGTTQPALSRSIRLLEARIGAKVLTRDKGDLRPTDVGARLAAHGEIIATESARASLFANRVAEGVEGEIRIGAPPLISNFLLPPMLAGFSQTGANVHHRIIEDVMNALIDRLAAGEIDFLFGSTKVVERRFQFTIDGLIEDRLVLVCRTDHPLLERTMNLQELARLRWIMPSKDTALRVMSETALMELGLGDVDLVYEVNTPGLIVELVRASDCVALLPFSPVQRQIEAGTLGCLKFEHPALANRIGLAHRGPERLSAVQRAFRAFVLKSFASRAAS